MDSVKTIFDFGFIEVFFKRCYDKRYYGWISKSDFFYFVFVFGCYFKKIFYNK